MDADVQSDAEFRPGRVGNLVLEVRKSLRERRVTVKYSGFEDDDTDVEDLDAAERIISVSAAPPTLRRTTRKLRSPPASKQDLDAAERTIPVSAAPPTLRRTTENLRSPPTDFKQDSRATKRQRRSLTAPKQASRVDKQQIKSPANAGVRKSSRLMRFSGTYL